MSEGKIFKLPLDVVVNTYLTNTAEYLDDSKIRWTDDIIEFIAHYQTGSEICDVSKSTYRFEVVSPYFALLINPNSTQYKITGFECLRESDKDIDTNNDDKDFREFCSVFQFVLHDQEEIIEYVDTHIKKTKKLYPSGNHIGVILQ